MVRPYTQSRDKGSGLVRTEAAAGANSELNVRSKILVYKRISQFIVQDVISVLYLSESVEPTLGCCKWVIKRGWQTMMKKEAFIVLSTLSNKSGIIYSARCDLVCDEPTYNHVIYIS